jgi:glycosyltransferase involved in cell wall biosynthesis
VLRSFGVDAPIEVIPNGIELEPYQNNPTPLERESLGIDETNVVLIYAGRMGPEKNLPCLLRSFAGIAQAYRQAHLVMVGDGPELEDLKNRVSLAGLNDQIHFTGRVDYEKIPQYLALADLFVTTSVTEVHPLTVIEAMASGLPVVGIDSPGVGDLVVDGVTGCLATNDLAAYTAKLGWMIQADSERLKMGQAAQQESQKYAIQKTVQNYLQLYQKLAAETAPKNQRTHSRWTRFIDRWGKDG